MHRLGNALKKLVMAIFPNGRLATFAVVMAIVEGILLLKSEHNPYSEGGPLLWMPPTWLCWFWLTFIWMLWGIERWCLRQSRGTAWSVRAVAGTAFCGASLIHIGSWGLYFQTGQFANIEVLRFLLVNPPVSIWNDLTTAERFALAATGGFGVLLWIASPFLVRYFGALRWEAENLDRQEEVWQSSWRIATMLLLMPSVVIANDTSRHRQGTWTYLAKTSIHPVTSLALSTAEMLITEPVAANLDVARLTPLTVKWTPPPTSSDLPSIIVVAVESLRADTIHLEHQGREVLPVTNRLARDGLQFTNAYSQSTHSDYADVCIVSSLYPLRARRHHYYTTGDPWPKTLAFDVFKQAGYATAIISSQNESWGNMDQFLQTPNLDLFYDAERSGRGTRRILRDPGMAHELAIGALSAGKLPDAHTMDRALDWITQQASSGQPFFLSMNFQSSHFPYEIPESAPQHFQPCELDADISFMSYPKHKAGHVRNAYYNGIHYCDEQIGRLVERLEELRMLDDVILVVLGENGEAFHENGSCGHAREPVEPAVHVATIIHAPNYLQKPQIADSTRSVEDYPMEHVDLLPTLFGLLEWETHPNFQGLDVLSERRPELGERAVYLHVNSAASRADAIIGSGRWKLSIDHETGREKLVDLAHDPQEAVDVSRQYPEVTLAMRQSLLEWRQQQLSYYTFPTYYTKYYPPRAPGVKLP